MSHRATARTTLIFAPLLVFVLVLALPYYSTRLSLILHAHPFADVVPKQRLDVFKFVSMDNMRSEAIVFSKGVAIGWIYQPMFGFSRFVPFSSKPEFDNTAFDFWSDYCQLIVWSLRWWLLPIQAVIFLFWLRNRERKSRFT